MARQPQLNIAEGVDQSRNGASNSAASWSMTKIVRNGRDCSDTTTLAALTGES